LVWIIYPPPYLSIVAEVLEVNSRCRAVQLGA